MAIFAALVVIGREAGTPAFNAMMLGFLGVFIAFTVVAEIAAVRAEQRVAESAARRTAAAARRRPATET